MTDLRLPLLTLMFAAAFARPAAPPIAATPAPDFTLADLDGTPWRLHTQKSKAIVLVFLSRDCPMANGYVAHLNELAARYRNQGVMFVGIFPSRDDSPAELKAHAAEYRLAFPLLRDPGHVAVAALRPHVVPEAFVLDRTFTVRYRGRIDDGYSARLKPRLRVSRHDLAEAIDDVLAGRPVRIAWTKAFGCPIPGAARKAPVAAATVTYHRDVLPILQAKCQGCHRPGQVGPFSLLSYQNAVQWAEDLVAETRARRMPPWKPAQRGVFSNERSLSESQIRTLESWLAQGTPEGDPRHAPPPIPFRDGWQLGPPDLVLEMPTEAVIAPKGRDLFHVSVLPTNLPEDRYLAAVEVRPGNPRVVHHTIQVVDTRGRGRRLRDAHQARQRPDAPDRGPGYHARMGFGFLPDPSRGLGGWAPGLVPQRLPEGVGMKLPKGADVLLQVHYHRTGKEERDRTRVGLYFQKGEVKTHFQAMPVPGLFLQIPAGARDHTVRTSVRLTDDAVLYFLVPHMHLLGKKIELTAQEPGGKKEALITIDEWDYNWQEMYPLKVPRRLPKGTLLEVRAVFDNSADNPRNPHDPPRVVRLGEETTNEMCFVFCGIATAKPGFPKFTLLPSLFRLE